MNKIEDIIQSVAEQTAKHTVLELRKQGMMKDDKQTPYQKTETLLYNYNSFLAAIEDKEEEINEIRVTGLKKHSNSVIPNPGSGTIVRETKTEQQKIDEKIADIRASISVTMRCIDIIDQQLEQLRKNEVYFELIPMKYFQGKTYEEIAEHFHCDVKTIYRQKKNLINKLQIRLFSDDVINQLYS
ncbi:MULTISPECIES: sigma factor-like helix-turn-helix DNA-binding protein [Erysipelotrichaceae]|jgi:DNA invertase Pin-like site-specific DNA recombinase|uniref:sigma factor-like helix-turn-helix DNA-binding protein n=1 Tax=Erysipelotrichaceae TaxID=128827 RepID=UPI000E53B6B3|nr:sigma factor-like helix-turn-helix DNA-binding protein [Absiella sp. AM27-20]RHU07173.1 sigma-70 family RNA polymerase sigma factor [Absiella sp. AM27-20]DAZ35749.1 MAG TPA: RNA polymerase sigma factor [Caudoviricetes sp.]